MTFEQYAEMTGVTRESFEAGVGLEAADQVREDLALEALFRALDMEVTEEDLQREFDEMGEASKSTGEDMRKKWTDMGLMPVIREGVVHRKAVGWLMENVEVVDVVPDAETPEGEPAAAGTKKPAKKRAPKKAAKAEPADEPTAPESTEE